MQPSLPLPPVGELVMLAMGSLHSVPRCRCTAVKPLSGRKTLPDTPLKASAAANLSANLAVGGYNVSTPFLLSSLHFLPPHQLLGQGHHWRSTKATLQLHCSTAIIQPTAGGWWEKSQEKATKVVYLGFITI